MKPLKLSTFFLLLGLMGCQPKGSFIYQFTNAGKLQINQVMVVIDYLNLRDDLGQHWDYDSYYHQKTLNKLLLQIDTELQHAGYPPTQSYLLSSGLLINSDFPVEHYIKEQLQTELLYPPYSLAQKNINDELIFQHQEFLGIMIKYMASRRFHKTDELSHRGMQMGYHFESMKLPDDTAILYVHINQSAVGFIKQLGTFLLSGAIASQADYGHLGIDLSSQKHASAFLVHKGSGQIIWKNHSTQWSTDKPITDLLKLLPRNLTNQTY